MVLDAVPRRPIGTMVVYGYPEVEPSADLAIATRLGATVLEVLPFWRARPDPVEFKTLVADTGLAIHSAHGSWGGQSVRAPRVDLGSPDVPTHRRSVDDLKLCLDWLSEAGGRFLVVHPGGLSSADGVHARRDALIRGLISLAEHADGTGITLCVENMPPGVHPGSRTIDLAAVLAETGRPGLAIALDTGHARLSRNPNEETIDAARFLATTHVHDNDGRHDTHLPPGLGVIDWEAWGRSLDAARYHGPIMLECIRHLRQYPETLSAELMALLERLSTVGNA